MQAVAIRGGVGGKTCHGSKTMLEIQRWKRKRIQIVSLQIARVFKKARVKRARGGDLT